MYSPLVLNSKIRHNPFSLLYFLQGMVLIASIYTCVHIYKLDSRPPPIIELPQAPEPVKIVEKQPLLPYSSSQKAMRKNALLDVEKHRNETLEAALQDDHKKFYSALKIEAFCPENKRIGSSGDGGKYVCNPKKAIKEDCTLLSLGMHNQIDYEQHLFKETEGKCIILGADKGEQSQKTKDSYKALNGQIFTGKIPDELTIQSMIESVGRNEVELLKIDIEGGEVTGLEPLIKDYYVCQIFIELHGIKPIEHLEMLRMMARYGFRIFNVDPNPYCKKCCEYSLINELCMAQYGVVPLGITIPH